MTYLTETDIKGAIDAWADAKVDDEIARRIERNKDYLEKYGENRYYSHPVKVEDFNRVSVRNSLAEAVYDRDEIDIPGLGTVKLVDSYGGEGLGEEYWRVYEIQGNFYKADHFYSSYDVEPWHSDCTWFPVIGREKVVTEWVAQ